MAARDKPERNRNDGDDGDDGTGVVVTFSSDQATTDCQGGGEGPGDCRRDWVKYRSWSPLGEEEQRGETQS